MSDKQKQTGEQTAGKDPTTGRFLPGNTIGKRWESGQSGNPDGRPNIKDRIMRGGGLVAPPEVVRDIKKKFPQLADYELTMADVADVRLWIEAGRGQAWAHYFIAERTEGKVKDRLVVEDNTIRVRKPKGITDGDM